MRPWGSVLLLWLLSAGPPAAHAQSFATPTARTPSAALTGIPTRRDEVGRILAPVLINGTGPFRFMVDTGASRSTISPQLVEQLGLAHQSVALLHGVTGAAQVDVSRIDTLEVGQLRLEHQALPIVTNAEVTEGIDGILGVAGLHEQCIAVDFQRERILITDWRSCPTRVNYVSVPLSRLRGGLVAVRGEISRVKLQAIIDTGAEHTLGNLALRAALLGKANNKPSNESSASVYGTTGDVTSGEVRETAPIHLAKAMTLEHVQVVFGDYHVFKAWGLERRPALLIGMDVLGRFEALVIDLKRDELHVRTCAPWADRRATTQPGCP